MISLTSTRKAAVTVKHTDIKVLIELLRLAIITGSVPKVSHQ